MKPSDDSLLKEVGKAVWQKKSAFLVGAGISTDRQSHLPGWDDLIEEVLLAIAGTDGRDDVPQVLVHRGQLLNEVLLQRVGEVIGREQLDDLIRRTITSRYYSPIHKFLSWAICNFQAVVITPNYDELIEEAARSATCGQNLLDDWLMKVHGSVSDLSRARYTVNSVYQPLDPSLQQKLLYKIKGKILVVAGYRGADQYDIMPLIFREACPKKVIWLVHEKLDEQVKADFLTNARFPVIIEPRFDSDVFFRSLYGSVLSDLKDRNTVSPFNDPELDGWHTYTPNLNDPDWWRNQVHAWSAELWAKYPHEVRFLWARILDYVRVYENASRGTRPAEDAYQRFLKSGVFPRSLRAMEAKARLAYIRRITGRGSLKEFREVLNEVEETKAQMASELQNFRDWDRLTGFILHQFGILLQNRGYWDRADMLFKDAKAIREQINDPEAHHSIFLQFMNAYEAHRHGIVLGNQTLEEWGSIVIPKLEFLAQELQKTYNIEQYSQILHNIAFVQQAIAEVSWHAGDDNQAHSRWTAALDTYIQAKGIRMSLRDPRMAAQSKVRIAQCRLGIAHIAFKNGDMEGALSMIQEAESLIDEVEQQYRSMPQEPLRLSHLKNIRQDAAELRREVDQKSLIMHLMHWYND